MLLRRPISGAIPVQDISNDQVVLFAKVNLSFPVLLQDSGTRQATGKEVRTNGLCASGFLYLVHQFSNAGHVGLAGQDLFQSIMKLGSIFVAVRFLFQ